MNQETMTEWTGIKGKIGAWYLNSPLRRLSEILFFGDCKLALLNEVSRIVQGGETVLDVGAGSGYFSLAIAKRLTTGIVVCLDLSEEMLKRLEQKAKRQGLEERIRIVRREASSSGLKNEAVDLVVSNGVFHELANPGIVLKEMQRVLKPNAWVIITDFRDTRIGKRIGAAHRKEAHGPWSEDELEILLSHTGLREVRVTAVKHWIIGLGKK